MAMKRFVDAASNTRALNHQSADSIKGTDKVETSCCSSFLYSRKSDSNEISHMPYDVKLSNMLKQDAKFACHEHLVRKWQHKHN